MNRPTPLDQARELHERVEDALSHFRQTRSVSADELQQPQVSYRYRAIDWFLTYELNYIQGIVDCFSSNSCWLLSKD